MIGLRVDIDSIGDIKEIPKLLGLLDRLEVKASFFVSLGPDRAGRNFFRYISRPNKVISAKPARFGFKNLVRGIFRPEKLENYKDKIREIKKHGHEVELHGYDHYNWMKGKMDITKAVGSFKETMGKEPRAFASPGFKITPKMLLALETLGLRYCSDFLGARPFYPVVNGRSLSTLQLPVSMKSLIELVTDGWSDEMIFKTITRKFNDDYFTFYIHPSFAIEYKFKLLEGLLEKAEKMGVHFKTFNEIAGARE